MFQRPCKILAVWVTRFVNELRETHRGGCQRSRRAIFGLVVYAHICSHPRSFRSVWHETEEVAIVSPDWSLTSSTQSAQHKHVAGSVRSSHFPSKQSQAVKTSEFTACVSTLLSKQPTNARSEWAVRGGRGWFGVNLHPPSLPPWTVLFFWSFMCRGSGQLRCSKNILRGWWLFKPFFAPADRTGTVLGFQSFDRRLFPLNDLRRSACANEGNLRKSSHRKGAAEHRRGWRVAKTF